MSWTREHEVVLAEIKKKSLNEIEIKSLLGDIKVEDFLHYGINLHLIS